MSLETLVRVQSGAAKPNYRVQLDLAIYLLSRNKLYKISKLIPRSYGDKTMADIVHPPWPWPIMKNEITHSVDLIIVGT